MAFLNLLLTSVQVQGGVEKALRRLLRLLTECCEDLKLPEEMNPAWPGLFTKDVGLTGVTLARDDDSLSCNSVLSSSSYLSSFQLKVEVLIICVAGFSGWVLGTVFVWCAQHIEVLLVLIFVLLLSCSLDDLIIPTVAESLITSSFSRPSLVAEVCTFVDC